VRTFSFEEHDQSFDKCTAQRSQTLIHFLVLLTIGMSPFGCANQQDRVAEAFNTRRNSLITRFGPDGQYDQLYNAASEGDRGARDRLVWLCVELVDTNYDVIRKGLYGRTSWADFASSTVVLGINAAGTVTGDAELKAILHAVSGAVEGTSAAFAKSILQNQGIPAVLAQMESGRAAKLLVITAGLTKNIHDYPVGAAIHDVAEYYKAGTFVGAISNIQKDSAVAQDKAEKARRQLQKIPTVDELLKQGGT